MTDRELLALRSQALGRIATQLTAVRALHTRNTSGRCVTCRDPYPCPTAIAAGVHDTTEVPA